MIMLLSSTDKATIILNEESLSDLSKLNAFFCMLYLGPVKTYQVEFPYSYLGPVNKVFDDIILKHKVRPVVFLFKITDISLLD